MQKETTVQQQPLTVASKEETGFGHVSGREHCSLEDILKSV
jgi:hypothetical protein